ncbi:MAG: lysylphosphatidylglycerol synthase domain-containing protein [candidate division WOR-3 bacterium]|nr:lysylphosphatidylglycerol synthase domain-containing protein [candidate division WOR-3 bacterium]
MKRFNTGKIVNSIFAIIGIAIIVYLAYRLKGYISEVDFNVLRFDYRYLTASFLLMPIWFVLRCYIWKYLLASMGESISLINSIRLIGLTNFGKYVPGKVWFTVGRTVLAERLGIPKKKSFASIIWDTYFILFVSTGFLLMLLFRIQIGIKTFNPLYLLILLLLVPFAFPAVFKRVMDTIIRLLRKKPVEYTVSGKSVIMVILGDILMWSMQGLQFMLLVKSFVPAEISDFTLFLTYPSAWAMGFIVLVMPAGLGIREGLITYVLLQILPDKLSGMAIMAALLSRIQFTIGELSYLVTLIGSKRLWRLNEDKKKS